MEFTQEQIEKVLNSYIKNKEYKNNYYRNRYSTDVVFKETMKNRSKEYYQNHKEEKKIKYQENAEKMRFMRNKRYHEKNNSLDKFKAKYPDLCEKYM